MAEFRRLISYIYEYEGQIKGKNVGFVKLETRNGMCRLSVNVKNLYIGSSDMGVYLLSGRKEIFLGNMFLRNGCGEFRTMVQVADVQESGEAMDECYGLTVHGKGESWRVYTTIWEDAIAQAAQLTLEPVTAEAVLERQVEEGKLSTVVPEKKENEDKGIEDKGLEKRINEGSQRGILTEAIDGRKNAGQERVGGEVDKQADNQEPGNRENGKQKINEGRESGEEKFTEEYEERESKEERQSERERQSVRRPAQDGTKSGRKTWPAMNTRPLMNARNARGDVGMPNSYPVSGTGMSGLEQNRAGQKEESPENQGQQPETPAREISEDIPNFEMGRLEMETRHPETPLNRPGKPDKASPPRDGEEGGNSGRLPLPPFSETGRSASIPVIRRQREEPLIVGDPEALAKLDAEDAMENRIPVWDFFSKTYPKIQAFDSEYGCQILVIKPQDIGLLPREVWIYGNNSFLLHGYYNYRYLILARLENPKGAPRYLLGIPGHYYSNEKYMASMFGFPHFVLSKKQSSQDGRFGYWYTDIRIDDGVVAGNTALQRLRTGSE